MLRASQRGLKHFSDFYRDETIAKEDLFDYIDGRLHSPDYRRYFDNLSKELPRIPRIKTAADFWAFSKAGRALAHWHLHYETVAMYAGVEIDSGSVKLKDSDYRVEKMRYGKNGKEKDLSTLQYNAKVTVTGIPLASYGYVINGKPERPNHGALLVALHAHLPQRRPDDKRRALRRSRCYQPPGTNARRSFCRRSTLLHILFGAMPVGYCALRFCKL